MLTILSMLSSSSRLFQIKHQYYKIIASIGLLLFVSILFVWQQPFVAVEYLMRDPAAIANHPIYYGALSNLGVLLWCASATVCLVGGIVTKALGDRSETVLFFAAFGGLSAMLCMDDLFLIHEEVLPNKLGVPESVLFVFYAVSISYMLLRFRKMILKTQPSLLGVSLFLFAISVVSDLIPTLANLSGDDALVLEDGSKFIAIFAWFAYFLWISVEKITLLASGFLTRSGNVSDDSDAIAPTVQETFLSNSIK